MFRGVIGYRDGWMCAVIRDPQFNEPLMAEQWFPIEKEYPGERAVIDLTGAEVCFDASGRVSFRMGTSPTAAWSDERYLPEGGRTLPIHTELTPIPCPRVRKGIETRYRNGRWEKYLQSKGWVSA